MQKKELGLVLKRFYPQKQKLAVLCSSRGRVDIVTRPYQKMFQIWPGMLISFFYSNSVKNIHFADNIEILMSPLIKKASCLDWLHHFLELCYYFVPSEKPSPQVFNCLYAFLRISRLEEEFKDYIEVIKKVFLVKLLSINGFYPEDDFLVCLSLYDQLTFLYIDFSDTQKVEFLKQNLEQLKRHKIKNINDWVVDCMSSHPYFKNFKTARVSNLM